MKLQTNANVKIKNVQEHRAATTIWTNEQYWQKPLVRSKHPEQNDITVTTIPRSASQHIQRNTQIQATAR